MLIDRRETLSRYIAAPSAPQAFPLNPSPSASPATVTASSWPEPIFRTTSEAQLMGA